MLGPRPRQGRPGQDHAGYGLSYGLVFGQNERKAISMAILDSALMAIGARSGQRTPAPANDQEIVLSHIDGIESSGFVEHLKLPHYVTFGSSLQGTLAMQAERRPTDGAAERPAQVTRGARRRVERGDDHRGTRRGQLHHRGDGVLHAHDD